MTPRDHAARIRSMAVAYQQGEMIPMRLLWESAVALAEAVDPHSPGDRTVILPWTTLERWAELLLQSAHPFDQAAGEIKAFLEAAK